MKEYAPKQPKREEEPPVRRSHNGWDGGFSDDFPPAPHPNKEIQAKHEAMQRAIDAKCPQPKLKIGAPNDKYEKEADATAESVMSKPDHDVQKKSTGIGIQRKADDSLQKAQIEENENASAPDNKKSRESRQSTFLQTSFMGDKEEISAEPSKKNSPVKSFVQLMEEEDRLSKKETPPEKRPEKSFIQMMEDENKLSKKEAPTEKKPEKSFVQQMAEEDAAKQVVPSEKTSEVAKKDFLQTMMQEDVVNKKGESATESIQQNDLLQTMPEEDSADEKEMSTAEPIQQKSFLQTMMQEGTSRKKEASTAHPIQRGSFVQREEEEDIQTKPEGKGNGANISDQLAASKGGGEPLPEETRSEMETRFGDRDFSNVRIHKDTRSEEMNKSLNSKAFANGSDVYFNTGQFDTGSTEGKKLLAHELTHTIQQGSSGEKLQTKPKENEELATTTNSEAVKQTGDAGISDVSAKEGEEIADKVQREAEEEQAIQPSSIAGNSTVSNENNIQKKPKDHIPEEDGEQALDGLDGEMDKDIRNPKLSKEERHAKKPPLSEKGEGVDKEKLSDSAKPNIDRQKENGPKTKAAAKKSKQALDNTKAPPSKETKKPKKGKKKMSPKELAMHKAKKAFKKASKKLKPIIAKKVKMPVIAASAKRGPNGMMSELRIALLVQKIQAVRERATLMKNTADENRLKAEALRGQMHLMEHEVLVSDEFIDKSKTHSEIRKQGVAQSKEQLVDTKKRVKTVEKGAPKVLEKANEGKENSDELAEGAREKKAKNDSQIPDDPDSKKEAEERGKELGESEQTSENVDLRITEARDLSADMIVKAEIANKEIAVAEEGVIATEEKIAQVDAKLQETTATNAAATAQIKSKLSEPDNLIEEADRIEKQADKKIAATHQLEAKLLAEQSRHNDATAQFGKDGEDATVQQTSEGSSKAPNIQLSPNTTIQRQEEDPSADLEEIEFTQNDIIVAGLEMYADEHFKEMNFVEKMGYGWMHTQASIAADLEKVNWSNFTEESIKTLVNPLEMTTATADFYQKVTHPEHQEGEGRLTYFLKELAGQITGLSVVFGYITYLAGAGMVGLAILNLFFPPSWLFSPPIYIELGALMAWTGGMSIVAAAIAAVLHGIIMIGQLIKTGFSETKDQLVSNTATLRDDANAAALPIITVATAGLFKAIPKVKIPIFKGGKNPIKFLKDKLKQYQLDKKVQADKNARLNKKHRSNESDGGEFLNDDLRMVEQPLSLKPQPRKVGNLQGGPLEHANQTSGKFKLEGGPKNGTLYRADNQGNITSYIVYDSNGLAIKRVDVTGAAHAGIKTPHVLDYGRNALPNGQVRVQSSGIGNPRPANPNEIP